MGNATTKSPRLIVIAGGNGAGKSTFYRSYLQPLRIPFINADEIARTVWGDDAAAHSYEAMKLADQARETALSQARSFCFETVFSHESKVAFLHKAQRKGFVIDLYIIHVESGLNVGRVEQRVSEGGHPVPTDKILERIPRTLSNLKRAIPYCDRVLLLDNSSASDPFVRQANYSQGEWRVFASPLADWAKAFVES